MHTILLRPSALWSGDGAHDDLPGLVCYLDQRVVDLTQVG
jgi:hypothetical protein